MRSKDIVRARAPLRLGLAGGGSDVSPYCDEHGGAILNVTINKFAYASIHKNRNNKIVFKSVDLGIVEEFDVNAPLPTDAKLALHRGVYERFVREFNNGKQVAITIISEVEAPMGSGLGSSSALVVAMVQAISEYLGIPFGEYDVARLAYDIERKDLQLAGGKQDQYAATFGGFNFMEFYADNRVIVNPLRIRPEIHKELEACLLLVFTGASRESAKIIKSQARSINKGGKSLEAMHQLKEEAVLMKEALLFGNILKVAEILKSGWEAKKATSATVSTPEVEELFDLAFSNGAIAGKLSGAGGGGFAMFLVRPENRRNLAKLIEENTNARPETCLLIIEGASSWHFPDWK